MACVGCSKCYRGIVFKCLHCAQAQVCQYHQLRIVQRYLTRRPELPASIELLSLANLLTNTDKESFVGSFEAWCERWNTFLKERTQDKRTDKSYYVHKRLRSAYLSLKRNMPYSYFACTVCSTRVRSTSIYGRGMIILM